MDFDADNDAEDWLMLSPATSSVGGDWEPVEFIRRQDSASTLQTRSSETPFSLDTPVAPGTPARGIVLDATALPTTLIRALSLNENLNLAKPTLMLRTRKSESSLPLRVDSPSPSPQLIIDTAGPLARMAGLDIAEPGTPCCAECEQTMRQQLHLLRALASRATDDAESVSTERAAWHGAMGSEKDLRIQTFARQNGLDGKTNPLGHRHVTRRVCVSFFFGRANAFHRRVQT